MDAVIIDKAYKVGQTIKKAVSQYNGDLNTIVHQLSSVQHNKKDFVQMYLEILCKYKTSADHDFILDIIKGDLDASEVCMAICMGILSKDSHAKDYEFDKNNYITLQKASELYNKADSTLRRNIATGKFKQGEDCYKEGKTWYIKKSALNREYSNIEKFIEYNRNLYPDYVVVKVETQEGSSLISAYLINNIEKNYLKVTYEAATEEWIKKTSEDLEYTTSIFI